MVEIIRLSVEPITTPDFPDPTPIARYVRIGDRDATLYLEDAAWNALCRIAREQGRPVDQLCADIEKAAAPDASLRRPRATTSLTTSPRKSLTGYCRRNSANSDATATAAPSNDARSQRLRTISSVLPPRTPSITVDPIAHAGQSEIQSEF